jgi:hypothetical protein
MPRVPERAGNLEGSYRMEFVLSGADKNAVIDLCAAEGVSLQQWMAVTVVSAVREGRGLPCLADGVRLPDAGSVLRSYLAGERVLNPCGRVDCVPVPVPVGGLMFCDVCGVRCG